MEKQTFEQALEAEGSSFLNEERLPLVLEADGRHNRFGDLLTYIEEKQEAIRAQLLRYGGVLFRGYDLSSAEHFSEIVEQLGLGKGVDYIGGDSPRDKVHKSVYTSTEAPPSVKIPLHNELSFVNSYPNHIYFFCEIPPVDRGETILGDARAIYKAIDPEVRARFEERRLGYVSNYYYKSRVMHLLNRMQRFHKSWIEVFETDSKQEVEEKCRLNDFAFRWNRNDWLRVEQIRPATMLHKETGEAVWFNQVHLYDFNPRLLGRGRWLGSNLLYSLPNTRLHEVHFADGSKIPRDDLYHILDVLDAKTIAFPWQKGDLLVLDNVLSMHGRATFTGRRRILTAMTS